MTTRRELGAILDKLEKMEPKPFKLAYSKSKRENYVKVEVDDLCVLESERIRRAYLGVGFPVVNTCVDPETLKPVLKFCSDRANIRCWAVLGADKKLVQQALKEFDSQFLENHRKSERDLVKYLIAACELQIKSLLNLTSDVIAKRTSKKDTFAIFKMFHLREKITVEEIDQARETWAFK